MNSKGVEGNGNGDEDEKLLLADDGVPYRSDCVGRTKGTSHFQHAGWR